MKSHVEPDASFKKPIHSMLVHFPLALVALSVAADVAFFFLKIESLRHTGWWALAGAAAGAALAVAAGIFDMRRASLADEVHARVHRHMRVGLALLAAIAGLTIWRWTFIDSAAEVTAVYLDCAILVAALAIFQGWLGGELVYSDGVFVRQSRARASPEASGHSRGQSHHH